MRTVCTVVPTASSTTSTDTTTEITRHVFVVGASAWRSRSAKPASDQQRDHRDTEPERDGQQHGAEVRVRLDGGVLHAVLRERGLQVLAGLLGHRNRRHTGQRDPENRPRVPAPPGRDQRDRDRTERRERQQHDHRVHQQRVKRNTVDRQHVSPYAMALRRVH